MGMFDMTYGSPTQFGGGALGGLGNVGMDALNGYWKSLQLEEALRKMQNERMLDQYRIPAQAAGYDATFFDNQAQAYVNRNRSAKLPAIYAQPPTQYLPQQYTATALPMQPQGGNMTQYLSTPNNSSGGGLNGYDMQDYYSVYGAGNTPRPMY